VDAVTFKSLQLVLIILIVSLAYVAAFHQMIIAYGILFDDVPTTREKKLLKKRKQELTP
jgi:hypothetical protein